MKLVRFTLAIAITVLGTALFAAERSDLPKEAELAMKAESARSAADHVEVARAYRLRAEAFTRIAEEHEAEVAKKQNGPKIGMAAKWPSMSRNSVQRQKREAVEARRVARECQELAILHTQLAVEKGFANAQEAVNAPQKADRPEAGSR